MDRPLLCSCREDEFKKRKEIGLRDLANVRDSSSLDK